jgi:hypothetical protein
MRRVTAKGLAVFGIVHARADYTQLKLTNAALHAEQESIVWSTRIIDAVGIDDACADQSAQLEQVMPIAAVTSKTRRIETKHGADFACTHRSNQPVETRPGYATACRAAKVIVDHFDVSKTVAPGSLDQVVLPTLALEVRLYLCLCGLTDIHNSLAAE